MRLAMNHLLTHLQNGAELLAAQIAEASAFLMDAAAPATEKADFLRALARKGETPEEIACFVREFLKLAVDPGLNRERLPGPLLDVVGTGGDKLHLFNISTTAMFILAGGGVCAAKHGNRGVTSKSGGADVLEALGIKIDLPPAELARSVETLGVGFLFAPIYHPAFKAVIEARKILGAEGQRSIFNLLGPLLNPARPDYQLIGVYDPALTATFASILQKLGRRGAWIVHGGTGDGRGMDELSTTAPNAVTVLDATGIRQQTLDAREIGIPAPSLDELAGGEAMENAVILEGVLSGKIQGAKRNIAVLNAAAGFVITGITADLAKGKQLAEEVITQGAALDKLRAMQAFA
jgi:anthranilate phosphoribosyltransferase